MGMAMWSLTAERKEALLKQKGDKHKELDKLRRTTKEEMWTADLDELLQKLTEVESKEKDDEQLEPVGKGKKKGKKGISQEACPSPHGIRIIPKIADDLRVKAVKAQAAKERKTSKVYDFCINFTKKNFFCKIHFYNNIIKVSLMALKRR